jgi:hypothetical protein
VKKVAVLLSALIPAYHRKHNQNVGLEHPYLSGTVLSYKKISAVIKGLSSGASFRNSDCYLDFPPLFRLWIYGGKRSLTNKVRPK